jgi:hypothetical protein
MYRVTKELHAEPVAIVSQDVADNHMVSALAVDAMLEIRVCSSVVANIVDLVQQNVDAIAGLIEVNPLCLSARAVVIRSHIMDMVADDLKMVRSTANCEGRSITWTSYTITRELESWPNPNVFGVRVVEVDTVPLVASSILVRWEDDRSVARKRLESRYVCSVWCSTTPRSKIAKLHRSTVSTRSDISFVASSSMVLDEDLRSSRDGTEVDGVDGLLECSPGISLRQAIVRVTAGSAIHIVRRTSG